MEHLLTEKLRNLLKVTNIEMIDENLSRERINFYKRAFWQWELTAYGIPKLLNRSLNVVVKEQTNKKLTQELTG
jgi:hypothetical protein